VKDYSMSNLFEQIKVEVETNQHGWATVEKAQMLATVIVCIQAKMVVEIGVWAGRSFVPMAMALKHNGSGKIVGIDPWSKAASTVGMTGENLKWWTEVDHDMIYKHFLNRLSFSGASSAAQIYRCRSDEVEHDQLPEIDLLHLDGNHSDESSCYDVFHFATKVRPGGFLFMDDIFWAKKATDALSKHGFVERLKLDTGALYQRT